MKRLLWVLPAVLFLAACAGATGTTSSGSVDQAGRGAGDFAVSKPGTAVGAPAPAQGSEVANGVPVPQAFDPTRAIILTANIAMKATDPWALSDKAQMVAAGVGGDVIGLSQSGAGDQKVANLTIRVPSDRFTDALRQLRALDAEVVSSTVDGKDVTDQFVDLKARLTAKQAEEQRYNALLVRASTIDEILKIDSALSNVRTQIEQLQGQVNSISARTQFSTITISITPAVAAVGSTPSTWDPAKTVAQALATLAAVLRGFADVAIWMLVFGWIPLVLLAITLILARGRRPVRNPA
ncbi:MAG: DUF4349 domain-containing protein [Chloroflexota bacterium]|nr:DUF4349 domain-containing protein [Chloroflexota bacterium]